MVTRGREFPNSKRAGRNASEPTHSLVNELEEPTLWSEGEGRWMGAEITVNFGARWKIEAGFKEIKQEIDSSKSQTRNYHAVTNHLNFCMMAATVTWIYAEHLDKTPQRCYAVNNRSHFVFSDVTKLITQAALNKDFVSFFPKPHKPIQNSFIDALLRMVA